MTARILTALFCFLAISAAIAQTDPSAAENPPDQQAYLNANKISDPEKKIAALEKLRSDFPGSTWLSLASFRVLGTLVQNMPNQTDRIRKSRESGLHGGRCPR